MTRAGTNSTEFIKLPAVEFSPALIMQELKPGPITPTGTVAGTWHQSNVRPPSPPAPVHAPSLVEANGYSSHENSGEGRGQEGGQAVSRFLFFNDSSVSRCNGTPPYHEPGRPLSCALRT